MSGSSVITYKNAKIVTAGDMSATITSSGVDLQGVNNYCIQASFSGSPSGTFKLQISTDLVPVGPDSNPAVNVVNFSDYTGSSQTISAAGNYAWKVDAGGERWVQLVWTASGGSTGVLNVTFSGKS